MTPGRLGWGARYIFSPLLGYNLHAPRGTAGTDREPRRVVGIYDWALRKGHPDGTLLVALERGERR